MRFCFSTAVLWMILALSFFCKTQLIAQSRAPEKDRPCFILLLTDDQSYHLSLIGTPGIKTPNMDLLAKNGIFFTRAYQPQHHVHPAGASFLPECIHIQTGTGETLTVRVWAIRIYNLAGNLLWQIRLACMKIFPRLLRS